MQAERRSEIDRTVMEQLAALLRPGVGVLLGLAPLAVLLAVAATAGELADRILLSFSQAAGRKFPTEQAGLVWLGDHFAALVKTALWCATFWMAARNVLRDPELDAPEAPAPFRTAWVVGLAAVYLAVAAVLGEDLFRAAGSADKTSDAPVRRLFDHALAVLFGPGRAAVAAIGETGRNAVSILGAWAVLWAVAGVFTGLHVAPWSKWVLAGSAMAAAIVGGWATGPLLDATAAVPVTALAWLAADHLARRTKTLTVALREFKALMLNPLGWGVTAGFAVVLALLFSGAVDGLTRLDPTGRRLPVAETAQVTLQPLTAFFSSSVLSFGFLILIPVITMRLAAEERRSGTLEVLLTSPVRERHVVAGKFLGVFGFTMLMWAISLVHLALLDRIGRHDGNADPGILASYGSLAEGLSGSQLLGAYLGLALVGAGFLSMGLFFSTLVGNQLAAAVLTMLAMLLFTFQGFVERLPGEGPWAWAGEAARYLDLRTHIEMSARGTPDSRTVFLFLSMTGVFLFLAVRSLEARRWNDMNLARFGVTGRVVAGAALLVIVAAVGWSAMSAKMLERLGAAWPAWGLPLPLGALVIAVLAGAAAFTLLPGVPGVLRALLPGATVAGLAAWVAWKLSTAVPEPPEDFDRTSPALWGVTAGLAAAAVLTAVTARLAVRSLSDRLVAGANVAVGSLAALVAAVAINTLAVRYHVFLDWSPEQAFTLRPESVAALAGTPPEHRPRLESARELLKSDDVSPLAAADSPDAFAAAVDKAARVLAGIPAAERAAGQLLAAGRLVTSAAGKKPEVAAADRNEAVSTVARTRDLLDALLPAEPAIRTGEFVECVAFLGRRDPPKDAGEAGDNFRRETLERLFRRAADSLNRPGNVRFVPEFLDPRDDRAAPRVQELRKRYGIEGNREVLLRYNNAHVVLTDADLFVRRLTERRFREISDRWKREFYEQSRHRFPPPETGTPAEFDAALQLFRKPKDVPPEYAEYLIPEEDWELLPRQATVSGADGRQRQVEALEEVLVNAVLRLVSGKLNVVCFTQGHGERELSPETAAATEKAEGPLPTGPGDRAEQRRKERLAKYRSIAGLRSALLRRNFQVQPLNAAETKGGKPVPDNCAALVICDPTDDFEEAEIKTIEAYLQRGGRVWLLLDPSAGAPQTERPEWAEGQVRRTPKRLLDMVARWGITVEDSVAVRREINPMFGGAGPGDTTVFAVTAPVKVRGPSEKVINDVIIAKLAPSHPAISAWQAAGALVPHPIYPLCIMPEARTVRAAEGAADRASFTPLISVGGRTFAQRSMMMWDKHVVGTASAGPDITADAGNFAVAAVAGPKAGGPGGWRMVVFGDSDFLCDGPGPASDDQSDGKSGNTYATAFHRAGESLAVEVLRDLCAPRSPLTVPAKDLRPFRAEVMPARAGRLLADFRLDVSEARVGEVIEAARKEARDRGRELIAESLAVQPHDRRRVWELALDKGADAAKVVAALQGRPDVVEVRESADGRSLQVRFADGTTPEAASAAFQGVAGRPTPRVARNQYLLSFAPGVPIRDVQQLLDRARRLELPASSLAGLKSKLAPGVYAKVEGIVAKLAYEGRGKLEEQLTRVVSGADAVASRDAVLEAARWDLEDVRPLPDDLLLRATVVHWVVLPGLLLLGGLAVHLLRRWS